MLRGEYGPDLEEVAHYHGLQVEDVIRIHSETTYFVYMLGFTPGFPYLGGLSKELETPRKETPRLQISPGSVGIGGNQTGIYPLETPGGWNIIGRTPITLFNPKEEIPTYIQSGMYLRFIPITKEEYVSLEGLKNGCRSFACRNVYNSQDLGRSYYQQFGVPVGGAMDKNALRLINMLVGNEENEAGLEMTILGPKLLIKKTTLLAIGGVDMEPLLNGERIPLWRPILAEEGSMLCFGKVKNGCRAYVTFAGGIHIEGTLGSKSTYIRAAIGGIEGRMLKKEIVFKLVRTQKWRIVSFKTYKKDERIKRNG